MNKYLSGGSKASQRSQAKAVQWGELLKFEGITGLIFSDSFLQFGQINVSFPIYECGTREEKLKNS